MKPNLSLIATSVTSMSLRQKTALAVTQNAKIRPVLGLPLLYQFDLSPNLPSLFFFSPRPSARVHLINEDLSEIRLLLTESYRVDSISIDHFCWSSDRQGIFGTLRSLHGSINLFIMFSLLQRGLGEESVVVLVWSCGSTV